MQCGACGAPIRPSDGLPYYWLEGGTAMHGNTAICTSAWKQRAERAEARVGELEAALGVLVAESHEALYGLHYIPQHLAKALEQARAVLPGEDVPAHYDSPDNNAWNRANYGLPEETQEES